MAEPSPAETPAGAPPHWVAEGVRAILARQECVRRLRAMKDKRELCRREHFGIGRMLRNLYLWGNKDVPNPDGAWLVPAETAWEVVRGRSLEEAYRRQTRSTNEAIKRLAAWSWLRRQPLSARDRAMLARLFGPQRWAEYEQHQKLYRAYLERCLGFRLVFLWVRRAGDGLQRRWGKCRPPAAG